MKTIWFGMAVAGALLATGMSVAFAAGSASSGSWDGTVSWERASTATPVSGPVAESPALESAEDSWLHERLSLGLALSHVRLTDNHRPPSQETHATFVGYLNYLELDDETDWAPVVTYWLARYLRVSLTWESVQARAYNYPNPIPGTNHGQPDGDVEMKGPVALLELTWPCFEDTLFPHVGGGVFVGFSDFHPIAYWHLKYSSPEEYDEAGNPTTSPNGVYREIRVDDAIGWVAAAGLAWRPVKHFELDLGVRKTWVEPDCEFGYNWKGRWKPQSDGDFTLDNLAWSLTASFVF